MSFLVLDFETTNLDKGDPTNPHNEVLLAVWRVKGKTYHEWAAKDNFPKLREHIEKADAIVAHNVKFELQWLARLGVDTVHKEVHDTMLAEFVIAGNRKFDLSLDSMAAKYINDKKDPLVSHWIRLGVCPSALPKRILLEYCIKDVELTSRLFKKLMLELDNQKLSHIYRTRCNMAQALADIEMNGLHLDKDKVYERHERVTGDYEKYQQILDRLSGGLNWNSPKQVGSFIYDTLGFEEPRDYRGEISKTPSGNRRTDEDAILLLSATTDTQREWLEAYRSFVPLKRKLADLKKMITCCDEGDGIVYANINQTVAQTHRTTSTGKRYKIQIQNVDRDLKNLYKPPSSDYLVVEVDAKRLEFNGAAQLSRDPVAIADIVSGKDIHKFSGSVIFKKPESEIKGEIRTAAKPFTFKPLYGGNSGTKDQKRYYDAFRKKYSKIYETQEGWKYEVLKNKKLVTDYGMVFYWPDTKLLPSGYVTNTPSIYNYPIQSFCTAEIIPISVYSLWYSLKVRNMKSYLVNTVHDSIVAYVLKDEIEEFTRLASIAFTDVVKDVLENKYNMKIVVPFGLELKAGTFWGDGSHKTYEYDMELN